MEEIYTSRTRGVGRAIYDVYYELEIFRINGSVGVLRLIAANELSKNLFENEQTIRSPYHLESILHK